MKKEKTVQNHIDDCYKKWPKIKAYLIKQGCPKAEVEDIFQEAILLYLRKIENLETDHKFEAHLYVQQCAKYIWMNQTRESKIDLQEFQLFSPADEDWLEKEEKLKILEQKMKELGEKCRQLLQLFYGAAMSMSAIAKKLDLRNEKVAKTQKYRCITKLKAMINPQNA